MWENTIAIDNFLASYNSSKIRMNLFLMEYNDHLFIFFISFYIYFVEEYCYLQLGFLP